MKGDLEKEGNGGLGVGKIEKTGAWWWELKGRGNGLEKGQVGQKIEWGSRGMAHCRRLDRLLSLDSMDNSWALLKVTPPIEEHLVGNSPGSSQSVCHG